MSTASDSAPTHRGRRLGPYRVLRGRRDLSLLFGGEVVSAFGTWLYITTIVIVAYNLTRSASFVAALTFAHMLPFALFLPLGGVLADRFAPRRVMIAANLGRAVCMLALVPLCARERIWLAVPIVFLTACCSSVFRPALGAMVPRVTSNDEELIQANALMTQMDSLSIIVGPALASVLILVGREPIAFVVTTASFAISAVTLTRLRPQPPTGADRGATHWAHETRAGFRHIFHSRPLSAVTWMSAGLSTFNGAFWTLAVVLAARAWHLGSVGLGILDAGYGIGGLIATLAAGTLITGRRLRAGFLGSMALGSGAIALFGLSPAGVLPFAAILLFGASDIANQVAGNTLIQQRAPIEVLGRVFGAFEALIFAAQLAGSLVAGPLILLIGPRATAGILAGIAILTLAIFAPWLSRRAELAAGVRRALPAGVAGEA